MSVDKAAAQLSELPPEMLEFTIQKATTSLAPRLGRLTLPGRKEILTPAFVGNTSRGVVPHISQDNFRKHAGLNGVYIALEDFVEKHPEKTVPIFEYNAPEPLRRFIALPQDTLIVLGARRSPAILCPTANTNTEIGLVTSVGFKAMSSQYYAAAVRKLQPDIVVGLADIPFGHPSIGVKRRDKMGDRTQVWVDDLIAKRKTIDMNEKTFSIFAPILPIDKELQSWYLEHLVEDTLEELNGIAIYDSSSLADLPEELQHLPRMSFDNPSSPQELLRQIRLGVDVFTIPFVAEATDAGIALDFTFPAPARTASDSTSRRSLGVDMWQSEHSEAVVPLSEGCACYTCTKHHRAYLQHLLAAKEMLGWVLIQLHNHTIMHAFFAGVRNSIEQGTVTQDVAAFEAYYEPKLPDKTGQGPRVRGYQFQPTDHGKPEKKNPKAYKPLTAPLNAFHGQQPNKKPKVQDMIDDEALMGLADLVNIDPAGGIENLRIEDDGA